MQAQDIAPDQLYTAGKMRNAFKRTEAKRNCMTYLTKVVEIPLGFVRDITIPFSDFAEWDRNRAAILPLTIPAGVCVLENLYISESTRPMAFKVTLYALIPGFMAAILILCRTTRTQPPKCLMFLYAVLGFTMSILWISFTGDVVIDLIKTLGRALDIQPCALGLTLVAAGNCLGDMSADVAMTKKGFGEMAITATMAGPVFNLNVGLGLAMTGVFLSNDVEFVNWGLFDADDGSIDMTVVVPVALIASVIFVQVFILINGCVHNYWLHLNFHLPFLAMYFVVAIGLVVYSLVIT